MSYALPQLVVIEDNLADQFTITEHLTRVFGEIGEEVAFAGFAADLPQARSLLTALSPVPGAATVVLVDLNLPGSRGLPTWDEVRKIRPDLRCIAVTGDDHLAETLRAEGAPVVHKDDLSMLPKLILAVSYPDAATADR